MCEQINGTCCVCKLKHSHQFVSFYLCEMFIFMLRSTYLGKLVASHYFDIPVKELERSKHMLLPLRELWCNLA